MIAILLLATCLSASAQPSPAEPRLAKVSTAAAAPVALSFETDARIELLSVLLMVARPEEFDDRLGAAAPPYAARARRAFEAFADHPAAMRLRGMTLNSELTELFLSLSPGLESTSGREPELLSEARAFAKAARFGRFYKDNAAAYAEAVAEAMAEAGRGLRPDSVTAYLRRADEGRHRFIVAPLLPPAMAANLRDGGRFLRVRAPDYARSSPLGFDVFGAGAAHEVAHDLLDPLTSGHRDVIDAYAELMYDGCAPTWQGCVLEHVDLAVTLRALAAERGEAVYGEMLRAYEGKYRYLPVLCARLGEWEARKDGAFSAFYPRLIAVFREAAAARAPKASGKAAAPRRRRPRP